MFLLIEVVVSSTALRNTARSVTDNLGSIVLSALFAITLVFLFAIIAFLYFQVAQRHDEHSFLISVQKHAVVTVDSGSELACGELYNCILTSAHYGIRDSAVPFAVWLRAFC